MTRPSIKKPELSFEESKTEELSLEDFKFLFVLGRGSLGKVYLAELVGDKEAHYAVKTIRKDRLLEQNKVENVAFEKQILLYCEHAFIATMDYLFQDDVRLYFVMPFIRGAEFSKVYQSHGRFAESEVKFYIA